MREKNATYNAPNAPAGYDILVEAICMRAVQDYRHAKKKLADPDITDGKAFFFRNRLKEVEDFFRSEWFKMLTNGAEIDPDDILERLDEED
jgi:hypothetical protein